MIVEVGWNLKHWMHWCECHYTIFRWTTWIGLETLTLGNRPKPIGLYLRSWTIIKCIMYETQISSVHHFICTHSFNIVKHHIIFTLNTKRPTSSWLFSQSVAKTLRAKVWLFWSPSHWKCMSTLEHRLPPIHCPCRKTGPKTKKKPTHLMLQSYKATYQIKKKLKN